MNKRQAEGNVNCADILDCMKNRTQEEKVQHSSAIKKNETQILFHKVIFVIIMVELDH